MFFYLPVRRTGAFSDKKALSLLFKLLLNIILKRKDN